MEPTRDLTVVLAGDTLRFGWCAESAPPPRGVVAIDDRTPAGAAIRRAHSGEGLAWLGDWHNGRPLLAAITAAIPILHCPTSTPCSSLVRVASPSL